MILKLVIIQAVVILAMLAAGYVLFLRPWLRTQVDLAGVDSFWHRLSLRWQGLKQRAVALFGILAVAVVQLEGFITPLIAQVDMTPIKDMVPSWVWPLGVVGIIGLMQYFRSLADKRDA